MRYIAVGLLQIAGVVWLVDYARGPDPYYNSALSRWEHASKDNAAAWSVVGLTAASAIALLSLMRGLTSHPNLRRLALPLVAVYLVMLFAAYFALSAGH